VIQSITATRVLAGKEEKHGKPRPLQIHKLQKKEWALLTHCEKINASQSLEKHCA